MFLGYNYGIMKRYWPLIVIVAILAAVVGVSQYAETTKQHCEERASKVKAASIAKGDDSEASNNAEDACSPPVWARYFTWPEGAGAWAVILTLIAIAWQSIETRDAAKGAFLNAQAVINAERPWIVVIVEPVVGPMGGFNVNIKNKGRTPAIIRGHYMGCAAVENIDKLPQKAPFGKGSMVQDRLVMPDETVWVRWFDSRIFKQFLGEDFRFLPEDGQIGH